MKNIVILVICAGLLSACGFRDSAVNPFNWFGRSQDVTPTETQPETNALIPASTGLFARSAERREARERALSRPIDLVVDVRIERIPGGAIIRATGRDARQGAFEAKLVPANEDERPIDGILVYQFERQRPDTAQPAGAELTREVIVARRLTNQQLQGVREIRVVGSSNARAVRR